MSGRLHFAGSQACLQALRAATCVGRLKVPPRPAHHPAVCTDGSLRRTLNSGVCCARRTGVERTAVENTWWAGGPSPNAAPLIEPRTPTCIPWRHTAAEPWSHWSSVSAHALHAWCSCAWCSCLRAPASFCCCCCLLLLMFPAGGGVAAPAEAQSRCCCSQCIAARRALPLPGCYHLLLLAPCRFVAVPGA
jgi:hypothetical protein